MIFYSRGFDFDKENKPLSENYIIRNRDPIESLIIGDFFPRFSFPISMEVWVKFFCSSILLSIRFAIESLCAPIHIFYMLCFYFFLYMITHKIFDYFNLPRLLRFLFLNIMGNFLLHNFIRPNLYACRVKISFKRSILFYFLAILDTLIIYVIPTKKTVVYTRFDGIKEKNLS